MLFSFSERPVWLFQLLTLMLARLLELRPRLILLWRAVKMMKLIRQKTLAEVMKIVIVKLSETAFLRKCKESAYSGVTCMYSSTQPQKWCHLIIF